MDSLCPVSLVAVPEKTSQQFLLTLKDYAGTVIPLASMTTLTLTLYNRTTGAIINGRNAVSVLNAAGGTYHATSGLFTMLFDPADMVIGDDTLAIEEHVALFQWTYVAGAERGQHEAIYVVTNSAKVT